MTTELETRPPVPPFTRETAIQKVRMAEDGWNSRDPQRISLVYTVDSQWRNRAEFPKGREQIVEFLTRKWAKELDYRLIKELWAFDGNRIAVRFAYEWHDDAEPNNGETQWFRSYGNENWQFNRGCKKFFVNRHFAGNCYFQKWNNHDYTKSITQRFN